MRRVLAAFAVAAIAALPAASHAASAGVDVVVGGFQFAPGGYVTTNPFDMSGNSFVALGSTGTAADGPTVSGTSITFFNVDPFDHSIRRTGGPTTWTTATVGGFGGTLTIAGLKHGGTYHYQCGIHPSMHGDFFVS